MAGHMGDRWEGQARYMHPTPGIKKKCQHSKNREIHKKFILKLF
jgi:hypothetical protein